MNYIIIPEYLATKKEGIVYFIYKVIPLLSIDIDKETVYIRFIPLADLIIIL
jgi:hypothetical protein